MENTNSNNELFFDIANKSPQNATKKYEEAYQRSKSQKKIEYGKQKKHKNKEKVKRGLTVIVLATAIVAAGISAKITADIIDTNNVVISINSTTKSVDELIENYEKSMNMYADKENSIETYISGNNNNVQVCYDQNNIENLAKHIVNAAKISETETRCVIIAAFRIINEPYREQVLGAAINLASQLQTKDENYIIPANSKEFLEQLGYENWKEYQMNERNNIKDLNAVENYIKGTNRKG